MTITLYQCQHCLFYVLLTGSYIELITFRVKLGIFGQTAKFGQPPCLMHSSVIGIKNKLTKQTVKILMRRVSSEFPLFGNVCPNLPDVRIYPTLPYIL